MISTTSWSTSATLWWECSHLCWGGGGELHHSHIDSTISFFFLASSHSLGECYYSFFIWHQAGLKRQSVSVVCHPSHFNMQASVVHGLILDTSIYKKASSKSVKNLKTKYFCRCWNCWVSACIQSGFQTMDILHSPYSTLHRISFIIIIVFITCVHSSRRILMYTTLFKMIELAEHQSDKNLSQWVKKKAWFFFHSSNEMWLFHKSQIWSQIKPPKIPNQQNRKLAVHRWREALWLYGTAGGTVVPSRRQQSYNQISVLEAPLCFRSSSVDKKSSTSAVPLCPLLKLQ